MNQTLLNPAKRFRTVLLLVLALLLCVLLPAQASAQLPTDIRAQFGGIEITGSAYWDSPGSTWFVLIRTPDKVNRLLCYTLENGTWVQEFQAADSVPQGEGAVRILFSGREKEIIDDQPVIRPVLMITQNGTGEDESRMIRQYEFLRSAAGEWNLVRAFFPDGPLHLETTLTRSCFDELTSHLVSATRGPVLQAAGNRGNRDAAVPRGGRTVPGESGMDAS